MSKGEAEAHYLEECKGLSLYGVWQFPAKVSASSFSSNVCHQDNSGTDVMIGICWSGVNVYRESIRVHRFPWQSIIKLSYRRHYFSVKVKGGEVRQWVFSVGSMSGYDHDVVPGSDSVMRFKNH